MIDLTGSKPCVFCGKLTTVFWEINPPDDSTRVFTWICTMSCYAAWSTNQPKRVREK